MAEALKTTLTELPQSRVRLQVEVPPAEVSRALETAASKIGRDMRFPGFRKGKVPAPVVISQLGREAVLDEAVRDQLGRWYTAAIREAQIASVGEPEIELGELPGEHEPFAFSIEIGVRPTAELGQWRGIEAARREPAVEEELIERQIEQARDRAPSARCAPRP